MAAQRVDEALQAGQPGLASDRVVEQPDGLEQLAFGLVALQRPKEVGTQIGCDLPQHVDRVVAGAEGRMDARVGNVGQPAEILAAIDDPVHQVEPREFERVGRGFQVGVDVGQPRRKYVVECFVVVADDVRPCIIGRSHAVVPVGMRQERRREQVLSRQQGEFAPRTELFEPDDRMRVHAFQTQRGEAGQQAEAVVPFHGAVAGGLGGYFVAHEIREVFRFGLGECRLPPRNLLREFPLQMRCPALAEVLHDGGYRRVVEYRAYGGTQQVHVSSMLRFR